LDFIGHFVRSEVSKKAHGHSCETFNNVKVCIKNNIFLGSTALGGCKTTTSEIVTASVEFMFMTVRKSEERHVLDSSGVF
jgi:hypothetical protein